MKLFRLNSKLLIVTKILFFIILCLVLSFHILLCNENDIIWKKAGTGSGINLIKISRDMKLIAYIGDSYYKKIKIVSAENGDFLDFINIESDELHFISFSKDSKNLIFCIKADSSYEVVNYDIENKTITGKVNLNIKGFRYIKISDDNQFIYAIDNNKNIFIWEYPSGNLKYHYDINTDYWAYNFTVTDDNQYLTGTQDTLIFILNLKTQELYKKFSYSYLSPDYSAIISNDLKKNDSIFTKRHVSTYMGFRKG